MPRVKEDKDFLNLQMGKFEVAFNKRYRFISLLNDFTLGLEFLIGSILFLFESTKTLGNILFIIGSLQLLGRPILKIMHAFYISRHSRNNQNKKTSSK